MIPDETIARVRESVNLAELIRESVPSLKKRGRNYQARCPFHQERTPSFHVNPEIGIFKCFGCGVGGDAFKFLMLTEGLSYPEAIQKIAQRVGIPIEDQNREVVSAEGKERQVLYGLLEDAAKFYHRYLLESSEAAEARVYLEKRGVTPETLVSFCIGFAPPSGHALRDAAGRKGWNTDILEKAGLLRRKEETGRIFDHFWNRIIFPIWDVQGRIIAFGGRAMGDAMPKYINSPETPVYSKSRHLYGLFQGLANARKQRHIIVLEGYMDVAVCHQFGLDTTAATLGTALTDDHLRLLRRYCDRVTLLFDPDAAGAMASLRGGEMLIGDGFLVDVVTLPDGLDPDELLLRSGRQTLEGFLAQATPFMDYFLAQTMLRHPGLTPESKLAIAKDILPVIRRMRDPLLQDEHLARVAELLKVDKTVLGRQMKRLKGEVDEVPSAAPGTKPTPALAPHGLLSLEEEILLVALLYPSMNVAEELDRLAWQDARCDQAWSALRTKVAEGTLHLTEALQGLTPETQEWLTPLALQERKYADHQTVLTELIRSWQRQQNGIALVSLEKEVQRMMNNEIPMDEEKKQAYFDLTRRLKGSKPAAATLTEAPSHG